MIVPLLVSVPAEIDERAHGLLEASPLVSVIEPALVKLAEAVVLACSPLVLSITSDWPDGQVAAQRGAFAARRSALAPEPV